MHTVTQMRQYQQQAVASASPEQLVAKMYDLGVAACHRQDRAKLRAVLIELITGLNFEQGGEIATRLYALYEFCMNESALGHFGIVCELLTGLRDAWKEGVLKRRAA